MSKLNDMLNKSELNSNYFYSLCELAQTMSLKASALSAKEAMKNGEHAEQDTEEFTYLTLAAYVLDAMSLGFASTLKEKDLSHDDRILIAEQKIRQAITDISEMFEEDEFKNMMLKKHGRKH